MKLLYFSQYSSANPPLIAGSIVELDNGRIFVACQWADVRKDEEILEAAEKLFLEKTHAAHADQYDRLVRVLKNLNDYLKKGQGKLIPETYRISPYALKEMLEQEISLRSL